MEHNLTIPQLQILFFLRMNPKIRTVSALSAELFISKGSLSLMLTKLEKNGMFVYESVPGSAVENFKATDTEVNFQISAPEDVNFTLELQPESEYEVLIGGASAGKMNTNLSGKLSVSVELGGDESTEVRIVKM